MPLHKIMFEAAVPARVTMEIEANSAFEAAELVRSACEANAPSYCPPALFDQGFPVAWEETEGQTIASIHDQDGRLICRAIPIMTARQQGQGEA